ncbi:hypothetical protein [Mycobacterium sherrisii]|uniref:Peptide synthetase n=1 Tax=Mycobacterium sherrisii TaxID=243061 RepID=A0A1E3T5N4_9MYCO|nr:hypothetical protein [Mycobacterium sherrisii]MCV7029696.1 peptide synthetase [Mycobacterium sherrisii]MEC4762317.1 peptide synthetase [Mycobacterium sherrisii]ODR09685.1 hypothetical protein BHQ21_03570 [Mycobacterium sherrisii]ORW74980.1 hypothetical protein AWC25_14960 [Mycobacterium sherrisii]
MTDNVPHQTTATTVVRPLGALERLFYRYSERNPSHFAIVAEFDEVLTEDRLRAGLAAAQRRHPLLSVQVEDRPRLRLCFVRTTSAAPIPLTVTRGTAWRAAAADELTRPIDRAHAPLIRARLLQGDSSSTLILTFDHTIADGISSVLVLNDVVTALNGGALADLSTPAPAGQLIARAVANAAPPDTGAPPIDPRMATPGLIRPFDGALPRVDTADLADPDTARLVQQCRSEHTTMHAAVVVAMCRVRAAERDTDFVRVLNPISFRALIEAWHDCALYMVTIPAGLAVRAGTSFWDQSRTVSAQLRVARSAAGIGMASAAIEQAITLDAGADDAENLVVQMCPAEMTATNLGVQNLEGVGPLRPAAVWGPVVLSQTDDEYVTGITTYEGRLRMVTCGYGVPSAFSSRVAEVLVAAGRGRLDG